MTGGDLECGLVFTPGGKWTWYIDDDRGVGCTTRTQAKDALYRAIAARHLTRWVWGPDRIEGPGTGVTR